MTFLHAPDVLARGRFRSGDELDAMARAWRAAVLERCGETARPIAAALPASPEAVALFVALTSLPSPVILLPVDARAWRTDPPIPIGTPVALLPSLAHLVPQADRFGLVPIVLPDPPARPAAGAPLIPLEAAGVVLFTSGSTGPPKPVFHTRSSLLAWAGTRNDALGLSRGAGTVMEASPAHAQGLSHLVSTIMSGGPLGLLDPRDHRLALAALAWPGFECWRVTPHFADVLSRCILTGPAIVPRICMISSPVPPSVREAFEDRFGVPLRQAYSTTETGSIAVDSGPPADVRPDTVGRLLPGVEFRIGDVADVRDPATDPASAANHAGSVEAGLVGQLGRIWIRSPWQMAGYGFPPHLERPGDVDGWWPTRDRGMLSSDGRLTLAGRIDDAIRTRDNRIVDLAYVAGHLRAMPDVTDALVIPLDTPAGPSFGAVVEGTSGTSVEALRVKLAETLPPWSWPRAIEIVAALPRLANGKPDRQACAVLLGETPLA